MYEKNAALPSAAGRTAARREHESQQAMRRSFAGFKFVRGWIKELCLGAKSPPLRWALDHVLESRASQRISLTDYRRTHTAIREPLQRELGKVLGFASEFETELYVRRFENDFARLCDCRFGVGTHSGTAALQLALAALGIGPGDEVITVPYTYIATALAISNTGATPVFVDIDDATFNINAERIEAAITPRTKAIMPVHLYGQPADMTAIMKIAAAHGLRVIEDACQAFGAELHGQKAGSLGDIGCFSFSTPKNLSGFGNGGMVVANDKAVIEQIRILRDPESNTDALLQSRRTPCYLDALQVAFIRAKLPFVKAWIEQRRVHAEIYRAAMSGLGIGLPAEMKGARHTYYRFAVRTAMRSQLKHWLGERGVRAVPAHSPSLHLTRTHSNLGYARGAFPHAESAEAETLQLPISPFITAPERELIIEGVRSFGLHHRTGS